MQDEFSLAVSKRLDAGGFEYPSIRMRMTAYGTGPVAVRVVESLPSSVDVTAVGFHADEGHEHWSVTGEGRIVYEDVVEAGETVSTLYGVADADAAELTDCLDAPTVQVAPGADLDAVDLDEWTDLDDDRLDLSVADDSPDSDRQNSPADGDWGDSSTTMNEDDSNERGEQRERTTEREERTDPADGEDEESVLYRGGNASQATAETADPFAAGGDNRTESATETDTVADRVAAELRRDEASEQTVATLRRHLTPDTPGGLEAKLDHCMTRIGELDAYVDALEEFLDEEGTAERLLAEVRDDLHRTEARADDVARRVDAVEAAQSRLDDRLADIEAEIGELEADVDSVDDLAASVDDFDAALTETRVELRDAVEAVESEVSRIDDEVESIDEWRSTVVTALSAAESAEAGQSDAD